MNQIELQETKIVEGRLFFMMLLLTFTLFSYDHETLYNKNST